VVERAPFEPSCCVAPESLKVVDPQWSLILLQPHDYVTPETKQLDKRKLDSLLPLHTHDDPPHALLTLPLLIPPRGPHLGPALLAPPPKLELAPSDPKVDPLARNQALGSPPLRPPRPAGRFEQPDQARHAPKLVHGLARQDQLVALLCGHGEPGPRAAEEAQLDALAREEVLERCEKFGRDVDLARERVGRGKGLAGVTVGRERRGRGLAVRGEVVAVGEEQIGERDERQDCAWGGKEWFSVRGR